jgi:glycosyltransferase involved in cell wall biosynthesis
MAGPSGRNFTTIARDLGLAFEPLPTGPLRLTQILATARLLRREQVQIVHARHGRDYWPVILAAGLSGAHPKIVLSRHLAKSPGSLLSRRLLLSQCDAFVAVSEFVAKVLREGDADPESDNPERHYRPPMSGDISKIVVAYGGFDMDLFKPADSPGQRKAWGVEDQHYLFALVGAYDLPRGKGQPEFLNAAAQIRRQAPAARFLIIGKGNMRQILEQQIKDLDLSGAAQVTSYCHNMPEAMNAIDCLVLPQTGTEAIPGVVCEAHACGRPVIASRLDGIPEAFAAAGYGTLVRPGSVTDLAGAMLEWSTKPRASLEARQRMHARVAERFSLERAARDLTALYERLLET